MTIWSIAALDAQSLATDRYEPLGLPVLTLQLAKEKISTKVGEFK